MWRSSTLPSIPFIAQRSFHESAVECIISFYLKNNFTSSEEFPWQGFFAITSTPLKRYKAEWWNKPTRKGKLSFILRFSAWTDHVPIPCVPFSNRRLQCSRIPVVDLDYWKCWCICSLQIKIIYVPTLPTAYVQAHCNHIRVSSDVPAVSKACQCNQVCFNVLWHEIGKLITKPTSVSKWFEGSWFSPRFSR